MLTQLFEDLRFVIGLFFAVISVILIAMGLMNSDQLVEGYNLNLLTGLVMAIFGTFMIGMSVLSKPAEEPATDSEPSLKLRDEPSH